MACREDDASSRLLSGHGNFHGGCGRKTEIHYIHPNALQGTYHHVPYHPTRNTCVTTNNHFVRLRLLLDEATECRGKLNNIDGRQGFARTPTDGSAYA